MPLSNTEAREAVNRKILTAEQVTKLQALARELGTATILSMKNVLIALGGLIAIGAISIWYAITQKFTGWEIVGLAVALGTGATLLTNYFLYKRDMPWPASFTAAFIVFSVTLAVFGYQMATGTLPNDSTMGAFHDKVGARWLPMELATIGAGIIVLAIYRLPFITMPIALTLWYMGMDLAPAIAEYLKEGWAKPVNGDYFHHNTLRLWVSVWFGLVTMLVAFVVDISTKGEKDFAFWPYLAGLVSFWFGLTLMGSDDEMKKLIYAGINVVLIFTGPFLMRKSFMVAGGVGLLMYIGEQASRRFLDSPNFLFLLLAAAGAVMVLGLLWGKYENTIEAKTAWMVPRKLRERWAPT